MEQQVLMLQSWWISEGFEAYLAAIGHSAQTAGDLSRWGGAIEMDVFGKIFNTSIKISKNHQGHEFLGRHAEADIEAQFVLNGMHWSYMGQSAIPSPIKAHLM